MGEKAHDNVIASKHQRILASAVAEPVTASVLQPAGHVEADVIANSLLLLSSSASCYALRPFTTRVLGAFCIVCMK